MVKLTVDGVALEVPPGSSVLQACEQAGREIPHFCYHERLSVAGNCRMCLVEIEKAPKPIASCSYPVAEGMVVHTDTPMVRNGRRGVMEFLLINHPLDCPICDQGGECDLQDQAYGYGMDHSRFAENKRAVKDKYLGPLVKTFMTRCIQCTRCVRFSSEIAGVPELGATARGETMEIGTYVERALSSELSGNLIDICPVGALVSGPYSFVSRPWELHKIDSIDVLDALGAAIRIDVRGPEVLRILPRENDEVNEEWLGDKSRFSVDGLKRRRLDRPWLRREGRLREASWEQAFAAIAARMQRPGARLGAIAGDLCDAESLFALKELFASHGSANLDCRQDGARLDPSNRAFYLFNPGVAGIDDSDAVLFIGSNPRLESPVLNARFRKRWLSTPDYPVGLIGEAADITYPYAHLGDGPAALSALLAGEGAFGAALRAAKRPIVVVGMAALSRPDGDAVLAASWALAREIGALMPEWNGFAVLHTAASRVGALDLGFVPGPGGLDAASMMAGGVDLLWLQGADELDPSLIAPETFVVYQGHHGDRGASRADVVLPGAAYTEKDGTYVNLEGRVQRGVYATFPPGEAREDWRVLRALSRHLGQPLPFDTLEALRQEMAHRHPVFAREGLHRFGAGDLPGPGGDPAAMQAAPFRQAIGDYFLTNPISRASAVMAECSAIRAGTALPVAAE